MDKFLEFTKAESSLFMNQIIRILIVVEALKAVIKIFETGN